MCYVLLYIYIYIQFLYTQYMCIAVRVFCPATSPEPRVRRLDKYVMLLLLLGIVIFFHTIL